MSTTIEEGTMETRERFLDAVRALAVVRVMVWHAFGFAAITYVAADMPDRIPR